MGGVGLEEDIVHRSRGWGGGVLLSSSSPFLPAFSVYFHRAPKTKSFWRGIEGKSGRFLLNRSVVVVPSFLSVGRRQMTEQLPILHSELTLGTCWCISMINKNCFVTKRRADQMKVKNYPEVDKTSSLLVVKRVDEAVILLGKMGPCLSSLHALNLTLSSQER